MASLRVSTAAVSPDLLADEDIREVLAVSVINMAASSPTNGDQIGLRINKTIILDAGEMNIEVSADVIDIQRDALIVNSVVGRGNLRMPVPAVTTEVQAWIQVDPLQ